MGHIRTLHVLPTTTNSMTCIVCQKHVSLLTNTPERVIQLINQVKQHSHPMTPTSHTSLFSSSWNAKANAKGILQQSTSISHYFGNFSIDVLGGKVFGSVMFQWAAFSIIYLTSCPRWKSGTIHSFLFYVSFLCCIQ